MSNYFDDKKWKQFLKESNCGSYKREPEEEFEDHEGQMARSQLLQISKSAAELMQMIDDGDELPAWVQSKLTKAADYLKAAQSSEEYDELSASLEEDCWDGYERNPDVPEGEQGSCVKKTNEAANNQMNLQSKAKGKAMRLLQTAKAMAQAPSHEPARGYAAAVAKDAGEIVDLMVELESFQAASAGNLEEELIHEDEICKAGKDWVDGKTIGGQVVKRGEDGKFDNWSARAAQIASNYCKNPNYGRGGKKKKNEAALPEGDLGDWEKENWTHSDGTPCGGGDKDGSQSRCKPASKWKGMSKGEKAADNAKKKAGTKAGKQYVPATKKGKVTKAHTK